MQSSGPPLNHNLLYYLVPAAARHGRVDMAAEALRASVRQGRVPYYDWLMLNPHLEAVRQRPGFDEVAAASRAQLTSILGVFGDARARGELPALLEPALANLAAKVRLEWPPGTAL